MGKGSIIPNSKSSYFWPKSGLFSLVGPFFLARRGYLLGAIQNKHETFAIKYDNHFK